MSRIPSIALAAVVAIVAVAAGIVLARGMLQQRADAPPALAAGTLLAPARPLPPIELVDQASNAFGLEQLRGRWSLLFFGFTSCPDICPVTMTALAQTHEALAELPPELRPQLILVSVDPQRDTPARLATYVKSFSGSFIGATASKNAVDDFARQMGVAVAMSRGEGGSYTVDHSAAVFLIDPSAALRALFSPPHAPKLIAADYRRVVASTGS